jgi:hypothetical protein
MCQAMRKGQRLPCLGAPSKQLCHIRICASHLRLALRGCGRRCGAPWAWPEPCFLNYEQAREWVPMRWRVYSVGFMLGVVPACAGWLRAATTSAEEPRPSPASASPLPPLGTWRLPVPLGSTVAAPSLSPDLVALRAWQALAGPLGGAAAALTVRPEIVVAASRTGDAQPWALTLRCFPRPCGAIVVSRF